MRLKTLFFPIVLVISLAIFVGYIWPKIASVRKINQEMLAKKAEMQAINEKRMAIESVGKKINENTSGEDVILKYLPQNKTEEQIIGGIHYLAGDANLSLVDISLNSVDGSSKKSDTIVTTSLLTGLDIVTPQNQAAAANGGLTQSTAVKISLYGDYAKIKIFLDSLQRMPVFNTVKSVTITKQESKKKDTEAADGSDVDVAAETGLLATIEVDFGYLKTIKIDGKQVESFKDGIDSEVVSVLQTYISQKSQIVDAGNAGNGGSEAGTKGKKNPFLTN